MASHKMVKGLTKDLWDEISSLFRGSMRRFLKVKAAFMIVMPKRYSSPGRESAGAECMG